MLNRVMINDRVVYLTQGSSQCPGLQESIHAFVVGPERQVSFEELWVQLSLLKEDRRVDEGMGHAALSPIEEDVVAFVESDISLVHVSVSQCMGDSVARELLPHLLDSGQSRSESLELGFVQVTHCTIHVVE